jgi:signal peptidase II
MSKKTLAGIIVFAILLIDQIVKIYIKTHFRLGEEVRVLDWFIIHFTENNGMAFGLEFGGAIGKYFLSIFRIVAVSAIGYYILKLAKDAQTPKGVIVGFSMILAGAFGNIIDSLFYGLIFTESSFHVATLVPWGEGYSSFLQGRVVDMLWFPMVEGNYPDWLFGGKTFLFFSPVFNLADSAITLGITYMMIFQREFFKEENAKKDSSLQ